MEWWKEMDLFNVLWVNDDKYGQMVAVNVVNENLFGRRKKKNEFLLNEMRTSIRVKFSVNFNQKSTSSTGIEYIFRQTSHLIISIFLSHSYQ